MAVGCICVRSTVYRASGGGNVFTGSPLGEKDKESSNHHQHEYQTSDGNTDSKVPLRYANVI